MVEWDDEHRALSYNLHNISFLKKSVRMCVYSFVCEPLCAKTDVPDSWAAFNQRFITGTTPGRKCVGVLCLHVYWMCLCTHNDMWGCIPWPRALANSSGEKEEEKHGLLMSFSLLAPWLLATKPTIHLAWRFPICKPLLPPNSAPGCSSSQPAIFLFAAI